MTSFAKFKHARAYKKKDCFYTYLDLCQFHVIFLSFFRDTLDVVKQSAALCLLRLFRTDPNIIPSGEWTSRIIHLLNDQHMGVVTAATSLIDALVKKNPDEYKGCVSLAVSRLSRVRNKFSVGHSVEFSQFYSHDNGKLIDLT